MIFILMDKNKVRLARARMCDGAGHPQIHKHRHRHTSRYRLHDLQGPGNPRDST